MTKEQEKMARVYALLSEFRINDFNTEKDLLSNMDQTYHNISKVFDNKWISVEDRLPEEMTEVFCHYEPVHPVMEKYVTGVLRRIPKSKQIIRAEKNGFAFARNVTHWQPLPSKPNLLD